ncbi:hypothetical protein D0Z70_20005 [Sphingobium terrigena]|uniref:Uncharacterized protein n=1 Tax=Sphingobium terrigena TaxID=2304063 RepID=A0A418YMT1_9SPHN|nr:hypothetical protein [Sphingobium terrigena]RJG52494.1 hypothetical protein D0Z70_20005 [Sphingobium terrigena]
MTRLFRRLLAGGDVQRVLLLGALLIILLVTVVTGLLFLNLGAFPAIAIAVVIVAAQQFALATVVSSDTLPADNATLRKAWLGFLGVLATIAVAVASVGWWHAIGGEAAARVELDQRVSDRLAPRQAALDMTVEAAVNALNRLSRDADDLAARAESAGGTCARAGRGAGPQVGLLSDAAERYAALTQGTQQNADQIRAALAVLADPEAAEDGREAIRAATAEIRRNANSLVDDSQRFGSGTPFRDTIAQTSTACANPQLAQAIQDAAAALARLEKQALAAADAPRADALVPQGEVRFGAAFGKFEIIAIVIAALLQFGILLFSLPRRPPAAEAPPPVASHPVPVPPPPLAPAEPDAPALALPPPEVQAQADTDGENTQDPPHDDR